MFFHLLVQRLPLDSGSVVEGWREGKDLFHTRPCLQAQYIFLSTVETAGFVVVPIYINPRPCLRG